MSLRAPKDGLERIIFAAGCFWHVQILFMRMPGVKRTLVGYIGGTTANPTYQEVCSGTTEHAEAVLVDFDPQETKLAPLLALFWDCHDPTSLNRQGLDVGSQYRSAVFYSSAEQGKLVEAAKLAQAAKYTKPIVTEIVAAPEFYPAEDYHQFYILKRRGEPYPED